jgi:hypothetical protein
VRFRLLVDCLTNGLGDTYQRMACAVNEALPCGLQWALPLV